MRIKAEYIIFAHSRACIARICHSGLTGIFPKNKEGLPTSGNDIEDGLSAKESA